MTKLKDVVLEPDEEMISYDVTALFTKLPIEESITIISEYVSNDTTLKGIVHLNIIFSYIKVNEICNLDHLVY